MVQLLDIYYRKEGYECIFVINLGGLSDKFCDYFVGNFSIIDMFFIVIGGMLFQCEVWKILCIIFCGQVMYYG